MQLKIRILTNILYFVFCIENEWRKKSKREKKNYHMKMKYLVFIIFVFLFESMITHRISKIILKP